MLPKVCIVGAGPAGLYVSKFLRRSLPKVKIDFFEKQSTPLGLLKYGVAPDRPSIREIGNKLIREENSTFFYNTTVGVDVAIEKLIDWYDFVVLACGAEQSGKLEILDEGGNPLKEDNSPGIYDAIDFIHWYNNYPKPPNSLIDYFNTLQPFSTATIIGNGNVALDVARILSTSFEIISKTNQPPLTSKEKNEFPQTDQPPITSIGKNEFPQTDQPPLTSIGKKEFSKINLIGRRSWLDAKFTNKELRELLESPNINPILDPVDFLETNNFATNRATKRAKSLYEQMLKNWWKPEKSKPTIQFYFHKNLQKAIFENNSLKALIFRCSQSGQNLLVDCNLLIKSVGFVPSELASDLRRFVDGRKVFECGWLASSGKGDLSHTVADCYRVAGEITRAVGEQRTPNNEPRTNRTR